MQTANSTKLCALVIADVMRNLTYYA